MRAFWKTGYPMQGHASASQPLSRRLRVSARNARQRLLSPDTLVESERTPFEVIFEQEGIRVRYYPPLASTSISVADDEVPVSKQTQRTPLVLVAPLAVNMYIYDLFEKRSVVKYFRARGFELYLIDWGRPGRSQNHFTLSSYFADWMPLLLQQVRNHSGATKLSLHGWSFGALFSYAYTALGDPDIENLVLVGAPCDYHANGALGKQYQRLSRQLRWVRKRLGFRVHRTPKRFWRSPGWANSLAFKLTSPAASVQGYLELVRHLHDEDYVRNHATNAAFLNNMVAYPGGVMQDIIQYLWTDNLLGRGYLPMQNARGESLRLDAIRANVLMVCGQQDPIVTRDCSTALLKHISAEDITVMDVPGGHMGILGGSSAPRASWAQIADWLTCHDGSESGQRSARLGA